MSQIITLLSDWRLRDPYVAMLKGEILKILPDAQIVDITHYLNKFDLLQTALLMKTCYSSFPEGTIHLILTNMSLNSTFPPVLLNAHGRHFIGEDNGVFHLMFGQEFALKGKQVADNSGNTLSQLLQLLSLAANGTVDGPETTEYLQFKRMLTLESDHTPENQQIEGQIIYIDAFNNAVTDIPVKMFEEVVGNRPFTATIQSKGVWKITQHYNSYNGSDGEMYLCNNALGFIEVAAYQSDVAVLADLDLGDKIFIHYE